jgi:hypothetical protein
VRALTYLKNIEMRVFSEQVFCIFKHVLIYIFKIRRAN